MSQGEERRKEKEEGRGEEGVAGCCAPMTSFFSRWRRKKLFLCRARPRHVRQFFFRLGRLKRGRGLLDVREKKRKMVLGQYLECARLDFRFHFWKGERQQWPFSVYDGRRVGAAPGFIMAGIEEGLARNEKI